MNVYKIRFTPGESRLARHFIPKIFRNFAIQFANRGINSNYDFCISLGDNCISAHLLRQNFLRKASFPFDWIAKGGISSRFSLIKNNFEQERLCREQTGAPCQTDRENVFSLVRSTRRPCLCCPKGYSVRRISFSSLSSPSGI